jgi:hypothetical protein
MTPEQRLIRNIKAAAGPREIAIYQGIVSSVQESTCTVRFGAQEVSGIRMRASVTDIEQQLLIVPKVGTAVVVGSLSGDLSDLVVLLVDEVERIELHGAKLGGLVNIEPLVDDLNALVRAFNAHTHTIPTGSVVTTGGANTAPVPVPAIASKASAFDREKLEDTTVQH